MMNKDKMKDKQSINDLAFQLADPPRNNMD